MFYLTISSPTMGANKQALGRIGPAIQPLSLCSIPRSTTVTLARPAWNSGSEVNERHLDPLLQLAILLEVRAHDLLHDSTELTYAAQITKIE